MPKNLLAEHDARCRSARSIMEAKNHDYTNGSGDVFANFRGAEVLGLHLIDGILLRMMDKMMRLHTFAHQGRLIVQGEGVKDAVDDIINYAVLISHFEDETDAETAEKQ